MMATSSGEGIGGVYKNTHITPKGNPYAWWSPEHSRWDRSYFAKARRAYLTEQSILKYLPKNDPRRTR